MSESTPSGRSSSRTTVLGVVAAIAVVVPAAWFGVRAWLLDDSAEPIPTDEVVADFREATATTTNSSATDEPTTTPVTPVEVGTSPTSRASVATTLTPTPATTAPPAFQLPRPGVYRYATIGFEEIDAVVDTRHDYPAETTITVTPDGCGVRLRWDALRERREEWRLCVTDRGIEIQPDSVQYHEFFDRGEEEPVECERSVLVAASESGAAVTEQTCFRVDEAWLPLWETVGTETMIVGDSPVEVVHLREQVVDDDDYWEFTTIDWYLGPTGLPVRIVNVKESNSFTFVGAVVYEEEYELDLVSLAPST